MPAIAQAVKDFNSDWSDVYGKDSSITKLYDSENNK